MSVFKINNLGLLFSFVTLRHGFIKMKSFSIPWKKLFYLYFDNELTNPKNQFTGHFLRSFINSFSLFMLFFN